MPTTRRRTPRPPTPETLRQQVVLEEHDLAPDGSFAIVTRRFVEGEHYVSHLWLVPLDGGGAEPRRLTTGTVRDMEPRIVAGRDPCRVHPRARRPRTATTSGSSTSDGGESVGPALGELSAVRHRVVARWRADRVPREDGPAALHRGPRAEAR